MKSLRKKENNNRFVIFVLFIIAFLSIEGCGNKETAEQGSTDAAPTQMLSGTEQLDAMTVIDDKSVYSADDTDSIVYFYVTVRYGSEARGTNHTFTEVNSAVRFMDEAHVNNDVLAEALVQVGDKNGPKEGMLGYGETRSNATIRIRGNSSSTLPVKSYKLKLDDGAGLWRGQSNIALNKHAFDPTRFRNKLYFDILKEIPEVPSLRTQFAILYIKDETAGETEFKNYGFYTQVEVPTKKYLKNHGMDSSGYLYKMISFNWEKNDAIKNFGDPDFDLAAMDNVVSCRGREDNTKLLKLIDMVNDLSIDINDIIDTYFDRENYITWLAYNILMGNVDTTMQNYYLYSPLNGNKWYFIAWDGDGALCHRQSVMMGTDKNNADWEVGISNYWNVILHQRFLKYASNRKQLAEKVEELYGWLNKDYIAAKAEEYNSIVEQYVTQMPDLLHLRYTIEERNTIVDTLAEEVKYYYEKFQSSLTALMPFWGYQVVNEAGLLRFSWGEAYDFSAKPVTYTITISKYPDMSEPIFTEKTNSSLFYEADLSAFSTGTYYWTVLAENEDGNQVSLANRVTLDEKYYPDVAEFYIGPSGAE